MPKRLLVAFAFLIAIALPAGAAESRSAAQSYSLRASLTVGQEVPRPKDAVGARGVFTGTITLHGANGTLSWRLTFSHLSGPALFAHIHLAPPGRPGPIIVPLCGPCKSGAHGSFTGPIGGNSKILRAFLAGMTYANVHTKKSPAGEIRGQIRATQAPVSATEIEWGIKLSEASAHPGKLTFSVRNGGKLSHQFIVLGTNKPAGKLPLKGAQVNLAAAGKIAAQITSIKPGKTSRLTVTLPAGHYVLFCNLPAHYKSGQYIAFQVR